MSKTLNSRDIQELATILMRKSSETAFGRLVAEARSSKQSIHEVAKRRASNMLRSMSLKQGILT